MAACVRFAFDDPTSYDELADAGELRQRSTDEVRVELEVPRHRCAADDSRSSEVVRDDEKGLTTAQGSIEVRYNGRTLRADRLVYDDRTGVIRGYGNIVIIEPDGSTEFAVGSSGDPDGVQHSRQDRRARQHPEDQQRLQLDMDVYQERALRLTDAQQVWQDKLQAIYGREDFTASEDPEQQLYTGFLGDRDRRLCEQVRMADPAQLAQEHWPFDDERDDYCPDYAVHAAPVVPLWNSRRVAWPLLEVEPRKYRFRILNASDSREMVRLVTWTPFCPACCVNAPHPPPTSSTRSPGFAPMESSAKSSLRVMASSSASPSCANTPCE